ncbi:hypothetical protein ACKWCC_09230 [Maribacter sp. 2307ULW6-5]
MHIENYLKSLRIIHGMFLFALGALTVFVVVQKNSFGAQITEGDPLVFAVPLTALLGYFGSQLFMRKQLQPLKKEDALEMKLRKFQTTSLGQYAMIEAPALFALVAYYLSGNALPLVIGICLLLYLLVQRPTINKMEQAIPLKNEELKRLRYQPYNK